MYLRVSSIYCPINDWGPCLRDECPLYDGNGCRGIISREAIETFGEVVVQRAELLEALEDMVEAWDRRYGGEPFSQPDLTQREIAGRVIAKAKGEGDDDNKG